VARRSALSRDENDSTGTDIIDIYLFLYFLLDSNSNTYNVNNNIE